MSMATTFPTPEWVDALAAKLNSDERYAQVAKNWEGDMIVEIEDDTVDHPASPPSRIYLDLWHGGCRQARILSEDEKPPEAAFILHASLSNILKIFQGELDPMQAMLTRRLRVEGNLAYMLRNVPTVLEFVRCCREIPLSQSGIL